MATEVRKKLDNLLRQHGLYERAREVLSEYAAQVTTGTAKGDVFDNLIASGIVDELLSAMRGADVDPALLTLLRRNDTGLQTAAYVEPDTEAAAHKTVSFVETGSHNAPVSHTAVASATHAQSGIRGAFRSTVGSQAEYTPASETSANIRNACKLLVKISRGKAFLAHLDEKFLLTDLDDEDEEGGIQVTSKSGADILSRTSTSVERYYVLHLLCNSQRWRSDPVQVTVEPRFDEELTFWFTPDTGETATFPALLRHHILTSHDMQLHVSLTMLTTSRGDSREEVSSDLIGSAVVEWRNALSADNTVGIQQLVPILPAGPGPHALDKDGAPIPVGLVDMQFRFVGNVHGGDATLPRTTATTRTVPETASDIDFFLQRQARQVQDAGRAFFTYAKGWWAEYKSIHPSFRSRAIKIFGENERGEFQPVCSYITPLSPGRVVTSAFAAARFVSLVPYRRLEAVVGGGPTRREVWHSPHLTLSLRQGDVEDHAVLLCSILLGFGLDAYVVTGVKETNSKEEQEYAWVMTRYSDPVHSLHSVLFWDPITGERTSPAAPTASGEYFRSVAAVFNHERFFANHSLDDSAEKTRWDWQELAQWKPMDTEMIALLPHAPCVPIADSTLYAAQLAQHIELQLKEEISNWRASAAGIGEATWDEDLEDRLQLALASYETERLTGAPAHGDDFAASVRRYVPDGSAFRGFPIMFNHVSPKRMLHLLISTPAAMSILKVETSRRCKLGLRVHVSVYPEDTIACWLMLAAIEPAS